MSAPTDPARLHKFVLLLSSDQPGEVVAASAAIGRLRTNAGATWHDLAARLTKDDAPRSISAGPDWRTMAEHFAWCSALSEWERKFVNSLRRCRARRISAKQHAILARIYAQRGAGRGR